ncbi:hypothetical protein Hanom_Chr02g00118461 [Helianthus anomalus]
MREMYGFQMNVITLSFMVIHGIRAQTRSVGRSTAPVSKNNQLWKSRHHISEF